MENPVQFLGAKIDGGADGRRLKLSSSDALFDRSTSDAGQRDGRELAVDCAREDPNVAQSEPPSTV